MARSVIVVTDGYVTVENEVFALVRRNLGNNNVFAFGIGSSVNRHLIEGIARAGQGEPFIVTKPELAAAQAERLRKMIDSPVLTHLQARFDGLEVYDLEPASLTALPDVLGGRPVVIRASGAASRGQLVLEGRAAQGSHVDVVPVAAPDVQAGALRQLWARSRIQQLSDREALEGGNGQREGHHRAGPALQPAHAIHQLHRRRRNRAHQRGRRAGEPAAAAAAGVSNLAVGGDGGEVGAAVPSTPEPGAWLSLLVVLALVGAALAKQTTGEQRRRLDHRLPAHPSGAGRLAGLQAAALWPHGAWMAARVQDGSDAPLGRPHWPRC